MFNRDALEELVRRTLSQLPDGVSALDGDLRRNLRATLTRTLSEMDLVTREEYELQTRLLARTREKLDQLEERAAALEQRLAEGNAQPE